MPTQAPLIPPIDPIPLPAPAWLLQVLLILTFLVHLVFMDLMLGGALLAAFARIRSRGAEVRGHWTALADRLMDHLPWFIAFTVTTGIAPLLFIQVLYGPLFYTSTISVGWIWLSLLLVIVVAYYAAYAYKFGGEEGKEGSGAPWWAWTAAVLFLVAAGIQVLANTLQITPERWVAVYQGLSSGFSDLSYIPRLLHFILAAAAFTGLYVVLLAVRVTSAGPDRRSWMARLGIRLAFWPTLAQLVVGLWLLLTLPRAAFRGLMGGSGIETALFGVGFVLAVVLMGMLYRLRRPLEQQGLLRWTAGLMLLIMLGMVLTRDGVRRLALEPYYSIWDLPVSTQAGVTLVFLVIFVVGLGVLYRVVRRVVTELRRGLDAGTPGA